MDKSKRLVEVVPEVSPAMDESEVFVETLRKCYIHSGRVAGGAAATMENHGKYYSNPHGSEFGLVSRKSSNVLIFVLQHGFKSCYYRLDFAERGNRYA
jgi:hypothetical protein